MGVAWCDEFAVKWRYGDGGGRTADGRAPDAAAHRPRGPPNKRSQSGTTKGGGRSGGAGCAPAGRAYTA
eukprot:8406336-Alexandrium_andersonii.AAC.1